MWWERAGQVSGSPSIQAGSHLHCCILKCDWSVLKNQTGDNWSPTALPVTILKKVCWYNLQGTYLRAWFLSLSVGQTDQVLGLIPLGYGPGGSICDLRVCLTEAVCHSPQLQFTLPLSGKLLSQDTQSDYPLTPLIHSETSSELYIFQRELEKLRPSIFSIRCTTEFTAYICVRRSYDVFFFRSQKKKKKRESPSALRISQICIDISLDCWLPQVLSL